MIRAAGILLSALFLAGRASAQAPNVSTYQGRLQESGLPVSGVRMVEVRLCPALTGGTCLPTAGSAAQAVTVLNGVFKTTFTIPSGVILATGTWFLELAVGPSGGSLNTMSPREQLTAFPYAVYASSASTLLGNILPTQVLPGVLGTSVIAQGFFNDTITNAILATGAVSSAKLQTAAVSTAKLATDAVDSSKILNGAVETSKLAVNAVTTLKLAFGAVDTNRLATDAVDSTKILDGSVGTTKIAAGAVNSDKLAAAAVTTPKLADNAVTTVKIAPAAVDSTRLASLSVFATKLAAASVETAKLAADAVTTSAILNFSVDSGKLASSAVSTAKLAADAVTMSAILNGAVGTSKISPGAIDTRGLNASAVTADKFAPAALMRGTVGLDRLGAMTRMASITGSGNLTLSVQARNHVEIVVHVPPLPTATDLRVQVNGLSGGAYAVTRLNGVTNTSNVSAAGIDVLGGVLQFAIGSQLHLRLVIDGNSGTPSFVTGTFQATGFQSSAVAPVQVSGSFGVNVGGSPINSITVQGISAALPAGSYVGVYGESF